MSQTENTQGESGAASEENNTVYGKATAVNGNTVTIVVGEMSAMENQMAIQCYQMGKHCPYVINKNINLKWDTGPFLCMYSNLKEVRSTSLCMHGNRKIAWQESCRAILQVQEFHFYKNML